MHELSIAMSIVEMAEEEAEQRSARIEAVHLKLGQMAGVVKEALLSSYGLACEGTALEGTCLVIEEVPIIAFCPNCGGPRAPKSMQWFACSECGEPVSEILQGKELEVIALEIQS